LGRDVNGCVRAAVDVDAAAVSIDVAVAELLNEDERHLGQVLVQVDRPVDVQRRPLVLALDSGRLAPAGKRELEHTDLAGRADRQPALEWTIERRQRAQQRSFAMKFR